MTIFTREAVASPRFILVGTFAVSAATYLVGRACGLSNGEWPGWLQAVGSIYAILVAVWVSFQQNERQRQNDAQKEAAAAAKEAAELRGILQSIRAELVATLVFARTRIGDVVSHKERGTPIRYVFPMTEDPFPIYAAFTPQLGRIEPDSLRRSLVATFTSARSFVQTVRYHNQMVEALELAVSQARQTNYPGAEEDVARRLVDLANYSNSLRDSFTKAMLDGDRLAQDLRFV